MEKVITQWYGSAYGHLERSYKNYCTKCFAKYTNVDRVVKMTNRICNVLGIRFVHIGILYNW